MVVGEDFSPLELPRIDEAVVSTRVRIPTGRYTVIARVGGAAGGIVIARIDARAATSRESRCRSYALASLVPSDVRCWPPGLELELAGSADDPVADMHRNLRVNFGLEDANASKFPSIWWTDESRLILHGKPEQHARLESRLQQFCEVQFKSYQVSISRMVLPRSAMWEILGERGAARELKLAWRDMIASREDVALEEHTVRTLAHARFGIRSGLTHYYVSDFQSHGGAIRAYPADDPVVETIEGGITLTAILGYDRTRPDVVDFRCRGVVREHVALQRQALEYPILLAVGDSTDFDFSATSSMRVEIELASASFEKFDFTRSLPLGRDVVVEVVTAGETVRVLIARVEEAL